MTGTASVPVLSNGDRVAVRNEAAIAMRVVAPPGDAPPRAAVLIGSAMGVRQEFYAPFALWLTRQGYLVVGASRVASLRGLDADLSSVARDFDAALDLRALVDCHANAPRRGERIAPDDVAARRIGHFGFLRDAFESTLWARAVAWLHEFQLAKETT